MGSVGVGRGAGTAELVNRVSEPNVNGSARSLYCDAWFVMHDGHSRRAILTPKR